MLVGWPRNDLCEHHDPHVQGWIREYVKPGDVFYDVGANTGLMSAVAAKRGALVVAFEPLPSAMVELRATVPPPHIVVNAAAWSEPAVLPLRPFVGPDGDSQGTEIAAYAINGWLRDGDEKNLAMAAAEDSLIFVGAFPLPLFRLPKPNVMKMDVEGGEAHVLRGCTKDFLTGCRAIISEVVPPSLEALGTSETELYALLEDLGFVIRARVDRDVLYVR